MGDPGSALRAGPAARAGRVEVRRGRSAPPAGDGRMRARGAGAGDARARQDQPGDARDRQGPPGDARARQGPPGKTGPARPVRQEPPDKPARRDQAAYPRFRADGTQGLRAQAGGAAHAPAGASEPGIARVGTPQRHRQNRGCPGPPCGAAICSMGSLSAVSARMSRRAGAAGGATGCPRALSLPGHRRRKASRPWRAPEYRP